MQYIVGTTEMFIGNKMAKSEAEKGYLVTKTRKLQAGHLQVPKLTYETLVQPGPLCVNSVFLGHMCFN